MYTGTLIKDLIATVERAECGVLGKKLAEEMELQRMFELQVSDMRPESRMQPEPIFAGAA
jgi:hypothetical protein